MKTPLSLTATAILGVAFATITAQGVEGEKGAATTQPQAVQGGPAKTTKVVRTAVTGSRIPRAIKLEHYSSGTEMALTVIDRKELDRLGTGSLNQAMKKAPMFR